MNQFNYEEAFSRNIGWLSKKEQLIIRNKTVAIAGMGGVGGFHLLTLCRLGVQNFHIADPDHFELANFNRQVGATMSSLHQAKNQTLADLAKNINPDVKIKIYDRISAENVKEFLTGSDLYVDGMDFFAVDTREMLFVTCEKLKIPAITAAPIGMGVNYLVFDRNGMSFMDYFQWENKTEREKLINFALGLAPKPLHLAYLVDPTAIDFEKKKGPSTIMSCMLCAGVTGVHVLKILLNRGKVYSAPHYQVFDPYRNKYKRGYMPWGNKNPIQRLKHIIVSKTLAAKRPDTPPISDRNLTEIEQIIDLARWSPSGDNTQPWRFVETSTDEFTILVENPLKTDLYDFDGKPTLQSVGCLIESIRLAANKWDKAISWTVTHDDNAGTRVYVKLIPSDVNADAESLVDYLPFRSVDRFKYQRTELPNGIVEGMNALVDDGYSVSCFTDAKSTGQIIKMNMLGTQVRLVLKAAHEVHQHVIQWDLKKTDYGIPYTATGLNRLTLSLLRRLMNNWNLMYFLNYHLGGAVAASIELDYLPGKNSAGFFAINASKSVDSMTASELITSGMQIQRIWLYLTSLNLVAQPCYTPIILDYYVRNNVVLSDNKHINNKINKVANNYHELGFSDKTIFIARLGYPQTSHKRIRSTRLPLDKLFVHTDELEKQ